MTGTAQTSMVEGDRELHFGYAQSEMTLGHLDVGISEQKRKGLG